MNYSVIAIFHVIEISFGIRRFIPLVSEIDAFLIGEIVAVFDCVYISGVICLIVVRKSVDYSARGIDFARNYAGNGCHTRLSGYTYVQTGLYAGIIFKETQLDVVAHVEQNDYVKLLFL